MSTNFPKYVSYILAGVLVVVLILVVRRQIREHMLQDDPILHLLKQIIQPLQGYIDKNYPEARVDLKNLKLYKADKSYTVNKDQIFLCVYDEKGEYYPIHTLAQVLYHEICHKINVKDVGHTENFYAVLDGLQNEAIRLGLYNASIPVNKNYRGGS